jgi:hypothetical protein
MGNRKGNVIAASIEPASTRQMRTIRARQKKMKTNRIAAQNEDNHLRYHAPIVSDGTKRAVDLVSVYTRETESLAPNKTQPRRPTISTAKTIANFFVINCSLAGLKLIITYTESIL